MKIANMLFLCLLLAGAVTLSAQDLGKETRVDSVLASVNGDPITLLDVMLESSREELRLASLYSGARLYSEISQLRKKITEDIIIRKLIYAKYLEKPFPIDNQYIERMLDHLAVTIGGGSRDSLVKKAEALGTTMDELKEKAKEKIAVDIMIGESCDRPVYVTPKEVYEYYQKNRSEWITPASYKLELLLVGRNGGRSGPDPKVACGKLSKQLKNGSKELFVQMVKAKSDAPNAESGGAVGAVDADKLRPEFAKVVKAMRPGQIQGPLETPEGYYFIRLDSIQEQKEIPYEKAAGEISKRLENQQKEQLRKAYGEKLKEQALIRYYF